MIQYLSTKIAKQRSRTICLLRVDLNAEPGAESGSYRLRASLPTFKLLLKYGVKIVVLSHRGRYGGFGLDAPVSLKPFVPVLKKELGVQVAFVDKVDFRSVGNIVQESTAPVILLENLRTRPEEQQNNSGFARKLAELGDWYVDEAFAVSHRKNSSIVAITKHTPSFGGLWMQKEVEILGGVLKTPAHPVTVVIGGAKVGTKAKFIESLHDSVDQFLVGGGLANTFFAAQELPMGDSLYDEGSINELKPFLDDPKIILPYDVVVSGRTIYDIGKRTAKHYTKIILESKTIVWNGPLGYFEKKRFTEGSDAIARAIASSKGITVAGGGETTMILAKLGLLDKLSFVSTGGGAMLEFLTGETLPGIKALEH